MNTPQQIGQKVQNQTLDSVRKTQDAVVHAVTAWTETAGKAPASAHFTREFPTVSDVIESNFAFAQQILNNQRDFAHRIIAATTPKDQAAKAEVVVPTTPAEKSATAAKRTATGKTSATRRPGKAPTN